MNFVRIQRLQRNQTVGYRIVQLAVDLRAFFVVNLVMTAVFRDAFVLQETDLHDEKRNLTEETIY